MIIETDMKNKMKTFKIETEDRYGRFNDYEIQAESLELATAVAKSANHYISDVSEVKRPYPKVMTPFGEMENHSTHPDAMGATDYDKTWNVSGYYNDENGNDIRDRD